MRRVTFVGALLVGLLSLVAAVYAGLLGRSVDESATVGLVILAGLAGLTWRLYRSWRSEGASGPERSAPGAPRGLPPERTPDDQPMTGAYFTQTIQQAVSRTESTGDIDEGLAVVRPSLRATLGNVLIEGGYDDDEITATLQRGDWTDDQVAAAVLDPAVPLPRLTLRERLIMWLFPQRFVSGFTRAAVEAIGDQADRQLSTIPGQDAPRPIPVQQPRIEELNRGVDDTLTLADDPIEGARPGQSTDWTDGEAVHRELGVIDGGDEQ